MDLFKDKPIIVTKTPHTAEEFIQKKIELLVNSKQKTAFELNQLFFFY